MFQQNVHSGTPFEQRWILKSLSMHFSYILLITSSHPISYNFHAIKIFYQRVFCSPLVRHSLPLRLLAIPLRTSRIRSIVFQLFFFYFCLCLLFHYFILPSFRAVFAQRKLDVLRSIIASEWMSVISADSHVLSPIRRQVFVPAFRNGMWTSRRYYGIARSHRFEKKKITATSPQYLHASGLFPAAQPFKPGLLRRPVKNSLFFTLDIYN